MAIWNFLVYALFPVPTILLVILSLPLPQFAKSLGRNEILVHILCYSCDRMQNSHFMGAVNGCLLLIFILTIYCFISVFILYSVFLVRKVTLNITNIIFFKLPIGGAGHVSLFHLAMGLSSGLLFLTSSDLAAKSKHDDKAASYHDGKCQRWRAERNFWISVLAFTM